MNQSQNSGFQAGQAKGQAEEKTSQMTDKVRDTAQSAMESSQQVLVQQFFIFQKHLLDARKLSLGQQMKAKAQGAADSVKDSMGMNK
ncbi:stress-induced protein KIN2-like [Durio zibethinus]|uniref:Stress-induced protein KIN2-like n=1 Tax=Durio zibethinus TaxID=66656 RepID=A0A6P6A5A1_DURZI|nr:stress-induced protein KIN2-like [Durio zibethinus]